MAFAVMLAGLVYLALHEDGTQTAGRRLEPRSAAG